MDGCGNSLRGGPDGNKRAVAYYYDPEIGTYYYGPGHHMKPQRVQMAHNLLVSYGVHQKVEVLKPFRAEYDDFCRFHGSDYVSFLQAVTPETRNQHHKSVVKKYLGDLDECPIFNGLYSFCQTSAGGSISGAMKLNDGHTDIAINWAGGLHHAKKCQASGFCYINDIVLAILELLKHHGRVLYIDIDVHHGDGVEEAFNDTDRVMTVSFHRFGNGYFPETGDIGDVGVRKGKYYSLNVPLYAGIDDESYQSLFKPIMSKAMEVFQPGAVVLQCGADSLSGDCLGDFNLSVKGHAECVNFMRSFNVPLLLLGGGGYTIKNVAKCWCYETGVAVGVELEDKGLDETLQVEPSIMENENPRTYLESIKARLLDNLSKLDHVPSVQFSERPPDTDLGEEQEQDVDSRSKSRVRYAEIYDSDSEEDYLRECERPSRVISEPAFLRKPEIVNAEHTKEAMPTLGEEHAKTSSSTPSTGEDNDCEYEMQARVLDNLSKLDHVPSVQFSERPPDTDFGEEQEQDVDSRSKSRVRYAEIYDSDSEEDYLKECERPSRVISELAFLRKPEIVNAEHTKEAMPTLGEEHAKTSSSTPSTGEENDCEYEMQRPQKETEKASSQKDENDGEDHMAEPMKALSKQNKCEDGVCTKLHICRSKAFGI